MKKFKFKLEGPLKLREFNEFKVKLEMAKINGRIQAIRDRIDELKNNISHGHELQEGMLKAGSGTRLLQLVSQLSLGARENILLLEKKLSLLNKEFEIKLGELLRARGEVKVIQKLKDKHLAQFRSDFLKKLDKEMEDIMQSRLGRLEGMEGEDA